MDMLKAALWYLEHLNFSIIPVGRDKKPFVKWEPYQKEKPTRDQIKKWWNKHPKANIGIVTGEISGIDVIDCDSEVGKSALSDFLSDSFLTPVSKTPKGWHYYFRYTPGLSNGVRVLTDCDIRTTGGYIIAPPSQNGKGVAYAWLEDLKISETPLSDMPSFLHDILSGAAQVEANTSEHINKKEYSIRGDDTPNASKGLQGAAKRDISFEAGSRDDTLFHLANHLVRGGMHPVTIEEYLSFVGSHCNPPYAGKELKIKIQSALDRSKKRRKGLTDEIKEIISATSGVISASYLYNACQCVSKSEKSSVRKTLSRMTNEGLLEKSRRKSGEYRIIDGVCEAEDWKKAEINNVDIWLPFELNEMIDIPSGSIILIAGGQDAGKSALLMNVVKENMDKWPVNYFSSEINAAGFKNRINLFDAPFYDEWKVNFYTRMHDFADVIKPGELNIIDYLEIHDSFFEIAKHLADIFEKLNGKGIAIVALQKDPGKQFGRGGSFTEEKPVLSLALDHGVCRINKFKGEFKDENPRGKEYHFKLVHGSNFIMQKHWHRPVNIGG